MEHRLKKVMSDVLGVDINQINENSSPSTIENWDSLRHMNLIVALEEEFDLQFNEKDMLSLLNYKLLYLTISEKKNIS
jgi:acyl carrier protein